MKKHDRVVFALSVLLLLASATAQQPDKKYLGRWDLTVTGDKEYPSWLELTDEGGKLTANFVGRWGNARPLPKVELTNGKLTFVSPKEEEDSNTDMVYEGRLTGETLSGTVNAPKGGTWKWTAKRAPKLPEPKSVKWGKPVSLFDGKDLTGWTMTDPNTKTPWQVVDGVLVSPGHGPEIINEHKFRNFKLHVEFNRGEQSNSGVYLRGRYEVQIENESIEEPPSHHTGGVYGFLTPNPELPRLADKWETFDITLLGRVVTVVQDGKTIIDHKEIPGITGGALDSHEELPGPIYLQGSEKGHVSFRNITIIPAEE
jgi:Domain of Unknown Function (DUF1080)